MVENQEYAQEELNTLMKKYKENEDNRSIFFDEQRKAGIKPGAAAGDKKLFGIQKVEEEGVTPAPDAEGNSVHAPLFDAPGDLVIARKAAAAAEKAAAAAAATAAVAVAAAATAAVAETVATVTPSPPPVPTPPAVAPEPMD